MMYNALYQKYFRILTLGLLLALTAALAWASPGGITGRTLKSTPNGCGSCHGSSASPSVVVAISGPTTLNAGQTAQYTVTVNDTAGSTGGINIAASTGTLAVVSSNLRLASGELTHTSRQTVPSTYTFNYTAPSTAGTVTLYATGKGSGMNSWNWAPNLSITVTAAGSPPAVTTSAASGVTTSGATLNGSVNPNGLATNYYFQYGLTTSYGSQTASTSAGSGSAAVNVNAAISGLTAGTTYHYRLVATNSAGTTNGADLTFTTSTPQNPPTVTTTAASAITQTGATLNGTVNPNGLATNYYFQYGLTTSYGSQTATTSAGGGSAAVNVNASITGLTAGTTYHYRLVATSSAGTTNGADLTFTTTTAQSPPTVVTSAASGISQTGATLNGTVNPNGQSTTYYFQYGTTTGYGSQTASASAGAGTSDLAVNAPLSGLASGTTYHFRLVATSSAGTTNGADQTFTTSGAQGPPAATTDPATSISSTGALLRGTVNPNGLSTSYYFEYGQTTGYGAATTPGNAGSGSGDVMVSTNIGNLTASTLYHFRLVATNSAGTTYGNDVTFTTSGAANAPVVVTNPASNLTDTSARLNGTVNPNGLNTMYYFEYGLSTAYGSATGLGLAGSGNAPVSVNAPVTGLTPGNVYHFRLVAYNNGGTTNGDDQTFTTSDTNGVAGDLNGNGVVNVVDLVILANILAGNINIAENPTLRPLNGDMDQSGSLDATDYVLLSMMIAND